MNAKQCPACTAWSDMIGLEGLRPTEAYCPFCCMTQEEFEKHYATKKEPEKKRPAKKTRKS